MFKSIFFVVSLVAFSAITAGCATETGAEDADEQAAEESDDDEEVVESSTAAIQTCKQQQDFCVTYCQKIKGMKFSKGVRTCKGLQTSAYNCVCSNKSGRSK